MIFKIFILLQILALTHQMAIVNLFYLRNNNLVYQKYIPLPNPYPQYELKNYINYEYTDDS